MHYFHTIGHVDMVAITRATLGGLFVNEVTAFLLKNGYPSGGARCSNELQRLANVKGTKTVATAVDTSGPFY